MSIILFYLLFLQDTFVLTPSLVHTCDNKYHQIMENQTEYLRSNSSGLLSVASLPPLNTDSAPGAGE